MLLSGCNPFPPLTNNPRKKDDETKKVIVQNNPDMSHVETSKLSHEFIKCALISNPKERYSAEKLLNHPWMKEMSEIN